MPHPVTSRTAHDKWDADHVRMPCSPHNEFPDKVGFTSDPIGYVKGLLPGERVSHMLRFRLIIIYHCSSYKFATLNYCLALLFLYGCLSKFTFIHGFLASSIQICCCLNYQANHNLHVLFHAIQIYAIKISHSYLTRHVYSNLL